MADSKSSLAVFTRHYRVFLFFCWFRRVLFSSFCTLGPPPHRKRERERERERELRREAYDYSCNCVIFSDGPFFHRIFHPFWFCCPFLLLLPCFTHTQTDRHKKKKKKKKKKKPRDDAGVFFSADESFFLFDSPN